MKILPLVLLVAALVLSPRSAFPADDAATRQKLQRIKREMREKKKDLKRADRKERSILNDLDRIDREVQAGRAELTGQQKLLREAEESLRDVEKNNVEISRELSGLQATYGRRLRALYKMSRNGYAASFLATSREEDMLKRMKYLSMIADRDRAVIRDYSNALARLELQQTAIAEKKNILLERRRAIETNKAALEAKKRQKAVLLSSVREEKVVYEQTLRELEESSASLWAMIKKTEDERKAHKTTPPPQSASTGSIRKDGLPWPLSGQVLTRFGVQRHPQFKTTVFRRGIEIAAHEGEPVRAVSDGRVAYADWYKGYGKLVIIEHDRGFYTLYGNLSRLDLAKDDQVAKGQVIGLAGDTGSLKGSKLYFEMRRNGEAQDPLLWLAKR